MAGQAGWYRAPGEEGLLRYWNGTTWTEHRQLDPAAAQHTPPVVSEAETDPMAEYERQFDGSSPSIFELNTLDLRTFDFDQRSFDVSTPVVEATPLLPAPTPAPQPVLRPQGELSAPAAPSHEFAGAPASVPRSFAPRHAPAEFAPLGPVAAPSSAVPIALPASFDDATTSAAPRDGVGEAPRESETIVVPAKAVVPREPLAIAAPVAPALVAPDRQRVASAARGMGIALLAILIGIGAMVFFSTQSLAGPGELKTTGIVTSLGPTAGNSCTPIARFAAGGQSLTANASAALTPCPVGLGQDVDVIYSASDPASSARIQLGSSITQYLWVVPVLGLLFFIGSLITFVVRAGSIAAGIRLLRAGGAKPKEPGEAA